MILNPMLITLGASVLIVVAQAYLVIGRLIQSQGTHLDLGVQVESRNSAALSQWK